MKNKIILITLMLVSLCVVASAQNAKSVLEATMKNIGEVKSIQYSGSGAQFTLGQSVSPDAPWPRVEIKSFTRTVDYEKSASRQEGVGAQAPMATQFYAGAKAWGQAGANVTPAAAAVAAERQLQIWLTPHGFLKGALAHNATAKRSGTMTLITFTAPSKHRIVGTISVGNLVEKVETWLDNPVLGDMHVETTYSSYHDFGAFKFPAKIVQKQGGHPILDVTIADAKANVALDLTVPDAVLKAVPPPVQVTTEKLADGVWYLAGGTHYSVLVEFYNHVVVIEAPQNEDRSLAVIAEVKKPPVFEP